MIMKSINSDDLEIIENIELSSDEDYILEIWLKPLVYGLNPKKIRDDLSIDLKDIFSIDIDGEHPKFAYLEAGPPNKDKDILFDTYDLNSKIYDYPIIYPTNKLALKVAKWITLQCLFTKGLISYPTYANGLFDYFYIEIYEKNSNWHGIQKYQICCKNDDEICYRFRADTEKDLFTLTESDINCVSDLLNNPESPLHSHTKDHIKGGEGPMFDGEEALNRIERIEYNNHEAKGDLFPITLKEISRYVDILDLDRRTSRNILFKGTIDGVSNRTIDIYQYRKDDNLESINKDAVLYPYSTFAVELAKFILLQELYERHYLKFPSDKTNYTNGIQSFWKLKYEENEYVILNYENKVCFKLQYAPKQSMLKFPVIEIRDGSAKGKIVDHDTKDIGLRVYDIKEEKEKERKGMFNHKFGKVRGSVLALSYDGKIAVKKANTEDYVRYNAETSTVENIKDLVINDNKWFFMIPATDVEVGDIIKYIDGFYQVIKVNEENISAINLMNSTMTTIVKETIFGMSCYAKVISLIDKDTFGSDNNNMMMAFMMMEDDDMDMKELMMMQMFTNKDSKQNINPMMLAFMMDDNGDDNDDMLKTMLMMNMMNGDKGFDMSNMSQNPMMMMMMLLKDGNGGKMDKMMKFMLMSQMMNNQKTVESAKEKEK